MSHHRIPRLKLRSTIMRVDPNSVTNLTAAVDQSASEEARVTSELSSGLRVASLQTDPVAVAQSTLLGSSIAKDDTFVQTASNESSRLQVTDSTLGEVVTQITSALSTAVSGNNGTLNASDLASVAQTLSGIRDQVLSLDNTSYQGQYLFGGSQGSAPPFTLDTSTTPATANYNGDASVQYVETPSGQKIQVNLPGSTVFGAAGSGVLGALNQLISDYSGGATTAALTADNRGVATTPGPMCAQPNTRGSPFSPLQSSSNYWQTEGGQF